MSTQTQTSGAGDGVAQEGRETLSVTDNRTGETYEIEITDGAVRAMDLRQIKVDEDDFGLLTYDPAFTNTASSRTFCADRSRTSVAAAAMSPASVRNACAPAPSSPRALSSVA